MAGERAKAITLCEYNGWISWRVGDKTNPVGVKTATHLAPILKYMSDEYREDYETMEDWYMSDEFIEWLYEKAEEFKNHQATPDDCKLYKDSSTPEHDHVHYRTFP